MSFLESYSLKNEPGRHHWLSTYKLGLAELTTSVDGTELTLEVHLLDFNKDIYGSDIQIDFMHRIRGEKKFKDLDELSNQINEDAKKADEFFAMNQ